MVVRSNRPPRAVAVRLVAVLVAALALAGCGAPVAPSGATVAIRPTPWPAVTSVPPTPSPRTSEPPFRPTGPTETATVIRVVDGDTIVVRLGGRDRRLRYIGMDTPETKKPDTPVQWMGPEASRANAALVEGRSVILEKDVSETDRFGRLLRYVWLVDGDRWTLVDIELVGRGFAQVETDPPDVKYADRFVAAQRAARDAGIGLWGPRSSGAP
jgi:endonuclease YncB( thermonuclease family)